MYSLLRGASGGAIDDIPYPTWWSQERNNMHYVITSLRVLWAKMILADFNLVVSTQTAKPPNLIPHQIFRLYGKLLPDHHKLVGGALETI